MICFFVVCLFVREFPLRDFRFRGFLFHVFRVFFFRGRFHDFCVRGLFHVLLFFSISRADFSICPHIFAFLLAG